MSGSQGQDRSTRAVTNQFSPTPGKRLTFPPPTPHPASRIARRARTRVGVTLGSRPPEMTLMNSIHACSFTVSWVQSPEGARGNMKSGLSIKSTPQETCAPVPPVPPFSSYSPRSFAEDPPQRCARPPGQTWVSVVRCVADLGQPAVLVLGDGCAEDLGDRFRRRRTDSLVKRQSH